MVRGRDNNNVLDVVEALLRAQLEAIEQLRRQKSGQGDAASTDLLPVGQRKRKSQTEMAYEVLLIAEKPLHILEIVQQIQVAFGISVVRDSLVSAILKKVAAGQQFTKTGKNTYGLLGRDSS